MTATPMPTKATVIPALRYRDAAGAIEWLCTNFGFQKHLVVPGDNGSIAHAQLSFGNGMIMLGSVEMDSEYGKAVGQADGNPAPQAIYVVVTNADEVYQSAKAAGALMVIDIKDEEYGGRGFTCRDLEGHVWSIGTYDPWAA